MPLHLLQCRMDAYQVKPIKRPVNMTIMFTGRLSHAINPLHLQTSWTMN